MKVLVTGGSGHLGANLVRRLLEEGQDIRVLVQPGSDSSALDGLKVERCRGDLRDLPAVVSAARGCTHIYHCAAKISTTSGGEREIYECNVSGTRHLLRAAAEASVARVVVTGSFSAVGHNPLRPSDENDAYYPFDKSMPYEVSKVFVEHECWKAAAEGLDVVVAVSCAIVGPNDFGPSRMGDVLVHFATGKLGGYIPGGSEFVSTRDIVEGHLLAMKKGRSGQRYIFSTQFLTMDQLMGIYEEVTGQPRPRLRLSPAMMLPMAEVTSFVLTRFFPSAPQRLTPGAIRILRQHRRVDCSKARRELGYQPTSIVQALREAYEWFLERGVIPRPKRAYITPKEPDKATPTGIGASR